MSIQAECKSAAHYFGEPGAHLKLSSDESKVGVKYVGNTVWFRVPDLTDANQRRIPGWFFAGIWEYMGIPFRNENPDHAFLIGLGFTSLHNASEWVKGIGASGDIQLVYSPYGGRLYIKNNIANSQTAIGQFPVQTVFHAIQKFEEEGWMSSIEQPMKSLDIDDYVVLR